MAELISQFGTIATGYFLSGWYCSFYHRFYAVAAVYYRFPFFGWLCGYLRSVAVSQLGGAYVPV